MKKRISDLLDAYEDDSVELSGGTPLSSARIKELTMEKINESKKPSQLRRLPVRIAAVAAVIVLLTVSAFAVARVFGAGDMMQDLFALWSQEPLSATQVETLNGMGCVFDGSEQYSVTSNGATITPIAALADEDAYYLHLRIEAPEGTVLPDWDWDTEGQYTLYGTDQTTGYLLQPVLKVSDGSNRPVIRSNAEYYCYTLPDDDPSDNIKELVIIFKSYGLDGFKFNDNRPKLLTLKGLWVDHRGDDGYWDGTYTEVFRGVFTFSIGGSFQSQVATIDCGGAVWTDPDTGETNCLDTMKLSPLGIKFEFHSNVQPDNMRIRPQTPGDVRVVMKDGSEISIEHAYSIIADDAHPDWWTDPYYKVGADILSPTPEWELGRYRCFSTPLDLSQVDYVQFGEDYIYPISME